MIMGRMFRIYFWSKRVGGKAQRRGGRRDPLAGGFVHLTTSRRLRIKWLITQYPEHAGLFPEIFHLQPKLCVTSLPKDTSLEGYARRPARVLMDATALKLRRTGMSIFRVGSAGARVIPESCPCCRATPGIAIEHLESTCKQAKGAYAVFIESMIRLSET